MYRIKICDNGYKVLCEVVKDYARKMMENKDKPDDEDMAAILGCMLLLDDLEQAKHIKDKK